jgi:hypothetical protein
VDAIEKIRDEMASNAKQGGYIQVVGDMLLQNLDAHPEAAEKILADGKTIKGSLAAMRTEAQKHQTDGCGVLTDEEGFAVVLRYYGIDSKPAPRPAAAPAAKAVGFDVDLDDLLKR